MGAFLDKPKTDKEVSKGAGNGLKYGLSSMQGWRIEMEDAHCAVVGLPHGLDEWSFFAVFDGHAGARVSAHCAQNLLDSILQVDEFPSSNNQEDGSVRASGGGGIASQLGNSSSSITSCNSNSPSTATTTTTVSPSSTTTLSSTLIANKALSPDKVEQVKSGIRNGFLQLDEKMKSLPEIVSGEDKSGSTAVCALISPTHLFLANCGDSRAVLSRDGTAFFSTADHKPVNPSEKERIVKAGGSVMIQRVNGSLAVSRALGDFEYKQVEGKGPCEQLVSPEPEITVQERDGEKDEFLVLACDGIWDVLNNNELCDYIRYMLTVEEDVEQICSSIIDVCLHKGSKDNMSVVLVVFGGAPKPSPEAKLKDSQLDQLLETKVKDILSWNEVLSISGVIQKLLSDGIDGLPPGAGIEAKRNLIESIYVKIKGPNSKDNEKELTDY